MGKDTSPCIVGDYWLDKRRDGKSPDIWQITRYDAKARSDVYRSTRCKALDDAKEALFAHVAALRAKQSQQAEDAMVIPQLILYYDEHGQHVRKPMVVAGSLRAFIGFLMHDEIGPGATVAQLTPIVIKRFVNWRLGPHSYSVPWHGKDYDHTSKGIKGESVQRNIDDLRAALNHAANNARIPYVPKIPSVPAEKRSPPRDTVLSVDQLGALVAFTKDDKPTHRWILLMIGTAARPDACLAFDPAQQWTKPKLIDMHPPAWPRTKKHNPVVPAIPGILPVLKAWKKEPHDKARSRRTAWRTARRALGLGDRAVPKTIRHTIATELRSRGVPQEQISALLGHAYGHRTTAVYAKYDPSYLREAAESLSTIWAEVMVAADRWTADHLRTKIGNEPVSVIDRKGAKS